MLSLGCGQFVYHHGMRKTCKVCWCNCSKIFKNYVQQIRLQNLDEVSAVFWPCAACYGVLIPCFLFYLYTRQHVMLRNSRMPLELQILVRTGFPTLVKTGEKWTNAYYFEILIRSILIDERVKNGALSPMSRYGEWDLGFKIPKHYASDSSPLSANSLSTDVIRSNIQCALTTWRK